MALPPLHETDCIKVWGSPGVSRSKCIISAHGGSIPGTFSLRPGESVQFYVNPGQSIDLGAKNAGVFAIAAGKAFSNVPTTTGNSPNYSLSKFEGYHKGYVGGLGTAYEAVFLKLFSSESEDWGTYKGIRDSILHGVADPAGVMSQLKMDIVTIRFRPNKTEPTLEYIVQRLRTLGYKEFHCPFCRG